MNSDPGPITPGILPNDGAERQGRARRFVRKVVLPVLAIAAIIAIIWWLDDRQSDAGTSVTGVPRGLVDLPPDPVAGGLDVGPEEGKLAPDFILESLDGEDFRLSDLRGKAVVINFWATWCKPCRTEIPNLIAAYHRYRGRGLVIVGVNPQEGRSIIEPFAADFGMDFPIVIDRAGRVGDGYRLLGLPTTFFVDPAGVIRSRFTGPFVETSNGTNVQNAIDESELNKRIEEILP